MNTNQIVLTGNLTRDPELRSLRSGTVVCSLRLANNTRRKANGEWVDKANYFDVTVFGKYGESIAKAVAKGSRIAVSGRIEYREWDGESGKRFGYEVIAQAIEFLGKPNRNGASSDSEEPSAAEPEPEPVAAGSGTDDDIPV